MALTKQDQMVIGVAAVAAIGLLVFTMGKDDEEEVDDVILELANTLCPEIIDEDQGRCHHQCDYPGV